MPPTGNIGKQKHNVHNLSVRSFVHLSVLLPKEILKGYFENKRTDFNEN